MSSFFFALRIALLLPSFWVIVKRFEVLKALYKFCVVVIMINGKGSHRGRGGG